jgi:hypothetical protein
LTKIIVGVGLVEAKAIFERLSWLSQSLGGMLFDGAVGSRLVIPSVIIAGALVGFLYAYLFTQLVIAGLVARTDAALSVTYQEIVPRALQDRKEAFSDYIQGLVETNEGAKLDQIAVLGVTADSDLTTKRRNILAAVGERVNLADAASATNAMNQLSSLVKNVTGQDF